jgi:hypothetical protein
VALDGTKIKANASKHKAMSYGRMKKAEAELEATVQRWLKQAESLDASEDKEYGKDLRGDELPSWVANKQQRLEQIRKAKEALEAEAREEAARREDDDGPPKGPPGVPSDKSQRNFTDPESRIMKTKDGFVQGYNAQAVVDGHAQVIVAQTLINKATDVQELSPLVAQIKENTGRQAQELSADAGYCSEENLFVLNRRRINAYVATGRQKHGTAAPRNVRAPGAGTRVAAMEVKLRRAGHRSRYRLRKQIAEPVMGQIKHARGFRQFLLRGLEKVRGEWTLLCTVHNLLKLAGARP